VSAVLLEDVGKAFVRLGGKTTLVDRVAALTRRDPVERTWALRGISFAVDAGRTVGIIGRNGAGKTTLLRLLSGVSAPSEGKITVTGRISPLIGVGVGFNPELTGRENVDLNGRLLGMSARQLAQCFDDIVAFSEIESFLDAPVKTYSSGMFLRLAFAVAVHAQPDVFLVDEVLAVGDMAFQAKCHERLREIQRQGTTILVVTHALEVLSRLTTRAVLLHRGRMVYDGDTEGAISAYQLALQSDHAGDGAPSSGSGVTSDMVDLAGRPVRHVATGDRIRVVADISFHADVSEPIVMLHVASVDGTQLFHTFTPQGGYVAPHGPERPLHVEFSFTARLLTGDYSFRLSVFEPGKEIIAESAPQRFSVTDNRGGIGGYVDLGVALQVEGQDIEYPRVRSLESQQSDGE
jgi:ABC-type polysaccharide/polyol phosphate transport system ATPase subunit